MAGTRRDSPATRALRVAGFTMLLSGAYALFQRFSGWLAALLTIPAPLAGHWLFVEPLGNVLLMAAGAAVVWLSTRPT